MVATILRSAAVPLPNNALLRDLRFDLSRNFTKQPVKWLARFPGCASVDNVKGQKEIPIMDRFQQGAKPVLVVLAFVSNCRYKANGSS